MIRIYFVFREFPVLGKTVDTGVGRYLNLLAKGLSRKNVSIVIVTRGNVQQKTVIHSKNKIVIVLPQKSFFHLTNRKFFDFTIYNFQVAYFLMTERLKFPKFIVEFANWETEGILFYFINNLFHLENKVVIRLNTGTKDLANAERNLHLSLKIIHICEKYLLSRNDTYLICSTIRHANHSRKTYEIPAKKEIKIIPFGIEIPRLHEKKNLKKNNSFHVLFWGRIEEKKGVREFLEAIHFVLQKNSQTIFHIVGKDDGSFYSLVSKYLNLSERQKLVYYGYLPDQELKQLIILADVCVFPSYYESFGLSVIEAMSYGKAVITTNVGGIPEIVTSNLNGILIRPREYQEIVKQILRLEMDQNALKEIGKNARLEIQDNFTLKKMIRDSFNFYVSLLKPHPI